MQRCDARIARATGPAEAAAVVRGSLGLTAEQQLLPSVWEELLPDGGQAAGQGPAQVARVAERPHRQAVQVHRLHQVGQERPLQADYAPPGRQTGLSVKK